MNNYISETNQSIIDYLSKNTDSASLTITSQFEKPKSSPTKPLVSIGFEKISVSSLSLNDYITGLPGSTNHQIDMNLSLSIYAPLNIGAKTCYDIFYRISTLLINNNINIKFSNIECENLQFNKNINSFLLPTHTTISMIINNTK